MNLSDEAQPDDPLVTMALGDDRFSDSWALQEDSFDNHQQEPQITPMVTEDPPNCADDDVSGRILTDTWGTHIPHGAYKEDSIMETDGSGDLVTDSWGTHIPYGSYKSDSLIEPFSPHGNGGSTPIPKATVKETLSEDYDQLRIHLFMDDVVNPLTDVNGETIADHYQSSLEDATHDHESQITRLQITDNLEVFLKVDEIEDTVFSVGFLNLSDRWQKVCKKAVLTELQDPPNLPLTHPKKAPVGENPESLISGSIFLGYSSMRGLR